MESQKRLNHYGIIMFKKARNIVHIPTAKITKSVMIRLIFFLFYSDSLTISFIRIHKKNRLKGSSLLHHEVDCFVGEPYM